MRNVIVLTIAQFLGSFGQLTMVVLAGIIGAELAPDISMATLPVTFGVLGVAAATVPAALFMQRAGRRAGFIGGCLFAAAGSVLAVWSVTTGSFAGFCASSFMMGTNLAFIAQYRFAAAESVTADQVSKAIGTVIVGTLAGAFTAPLLAVRARSWLDIEFAGSFLVVAIITAAGAYAVMSMIMTATPLSMHVLDGYSVESTATVIQSHMLAMYMPSLISGWLVTRLGITRMMAAGIFIEGLCIVFAQSGNDLVHYWGGLVALGLGWNLLFISSTTLLTRIYNPAERFKVQALNEFSMFGVMAAASLLAGLLISLIGWQALNRLALLPLAIMGAGLAVLIFRHRHLT